MTAWLAETLVATTLLMLLVLAARPLVRRAFGASAAYALWVVPALGLITPRLEAPSAPLPGLAAQPVEIVFAAAAPAAGAATWLGAIWVVGAAAFGLWHVVAYRRFLARAGDAASRRDGRAPEISYSNAVAGPAAVGLLRPRILLPADFDARFNPAERELAMRHERVHHKRGDLWANAAALGMLCVHWFNPLAHWAYRAFREDQELSCDAKVIAASEPEERAAYGAAMVKAAWGAAPMTTCPMTRTTNLKRRLKMVKTHRKSALASLGGALTLGLTAIGGLALTAGPSIAAASQAAAGPVVKQETIIIKGGPGTNASAEISKFLDSKCAPADRTEYQTSGGAGAKPSRVILCNKKGVTSVDAAALQKARDRLAASSDLDADKRAKALSALDEALAKLRSR